MWVYRLEAFLSSWKRVSAIFTFLDLQSWSLIICTFTISTGFRTTSEVGGAFIYINHKPIYFSGKEKFFWKRRERKKTSEQHGKQKH